MARFKIPAAFLVAMLCMGASGLPEGTGSQTFHAWAGFGVGSSATLASTSENPRGVLASTMTQTLIEKADDHLVLGSWASVIMGGKPEQIPPTKMTVQAAPDATIGETLIGTEDVIAAGKTFSCKIFTVAHKDDESIKLKIWVCSDVPGGIVKLELDGRSTKIRSLLKSFEAK